MWKFITTLRWSIWIWKTSESLKSMIWNADSEPYRTIQFLENNLFFDRRMTRRIDDLRLTIDEVVCCGRPLAES